MSEVELMWKERLREAVGSLGQAFRIKLWNDREHEDRKREDCHLRQLKRIYRWILEATQHRTLPGRVQ